MQTITKQSITAFYREFLNNFITIERMAEFYEMPFEDCKYLIQLGGKYHNEMCNDLKGRYTKSNSVR